MPPPIASPAYNVPFFSTNSSNISLVNDISWFTGKFYHFKATVRDTLPAIGFGTVVLRVVRDFHRRTLEINETDELKFFALLVPGMRWNMVVSQDMIDAHLAEGRNCYIRGPRNRRVAHLVRRPHVFPRVWLDGQDIDATTIGPETGLYITTWISGTDRKRVDYFRNFCNSITGSERDVGNNHGSSAWSQADQTWCDANIGTKAQFFDNFGLDLNTSHDEVRAKYLLCRCQEVLASAEHDEVLASAEREAASPVESEPSDEDAYPMESESSGDE